MAVSALSRSSIGTFDKFQKTSVGNSNAANAVFLMGGAYASTTNYSTSSDGITWTLRSLGVGFGRSYGVTKVGNYYYNVDGGTVGLSATTDATAGTPFQISQFGNIGTSNTFRTAAYQKEQWVWWGDYGWAANNLVVVNGAGTNVTGLVYGNSTWVIIRANVIYTQTSQPNFPTTGTWTSRTSSVTSPTNVTFANGLFVVTGSNGIATSSDGITWTTRSSAGNFAASRVFYTGGLWITAINGGSIYTSSDGITWTARSATLTSSVLIGASYGNGIYTAMSSTGLLWSSTDGVTWTSRTNPQAGSNWYSEAGSLSVIYFG